MSRTATSTATTAAAPPIDDVETYWSPAERARVTSMLRRSFVGSADTVKDGLQAFVDETGAIRDTGTTTCH